MSEADRFGTDAAAEEYNRRQQKKLEREVRPVARDMSLLWRPSRSERARCAPDTIPRVLSSWHEDRLRDRARSSSRRRGHPVPIPNRTRAHPTPP